MAGRELDEGFGWFGRDGCRAKRRDKIPQKFLYLLAVSEIEAEEGEGQIYSEPQEK